MSAPPDHAPDGVSAESRSVLAERLRRRKSKRSLLERVSIQSKLMLMLLTMSVLATGIAGGIGFQSGRSSLRAAVFDRLTGVREAQSRVLEMGLTNITGSLVVFSRGETVISAMNAFNAGFDQLAGATITPEQDRALVDFYTAKFKSTDDSRLDVNALLPISPAARYLQARYTVPTAAARRQRPRDGSIWSGANARYNGYFSEIVKRMGFRDAFLINARGDVVYSVNKGVELGTNVLTGPYRGEGFLPDAFRKAMASNDIDYVDTTDFAEYLPSGQPTAWMLVPIGPPGRASGRDGRGVPGHHRQQPDDRRPAVGTRRHGQHRRDVRGRQGRPDAVGLPAVPAGSGGLQGRRHQGGNAARGRRTRHQAGHHRAGPAGRHQGHRSRAAWRDRNPDRHRLSRPPGTAGLRPAQPQGSGLGRRRRGGLRGGVRPGAQLRAQTGAVDGLDHLPGLPGRHGCGRGCSCGPSSVSRTAPKRSAPATTTSGYRWTPTTNSAI